MTQAKDTAQAAHNKIVKSGIMLGFLVTTFYGVVLFYVIGPFEAATQFQDRITLAIQCALLPGLMLLIGIGVLGSGRFGNEAEDPTACQASSQGMKVNVRYLSNTHEQFTLFLIALLGLALALPAPALTLLPIYASLFVIGRIAFWIGYHINPLYRALGFGMTFYPTVTAMLYNFYAVLSGLL